MLAFGRLSEATSANLDDIRLGNFLQSQTPIGTLAKVSGVSLERIVFFVYRCCRHLYTKEIAFHIKPAALSM